MCPLFDIPIIPRLILEFASLRLGIVSHTTREVLAVVHFIVGPIRQCRETDVRGGRGEYKYWRMSKQDNLRIEVGDEG